MRDEEVEIIPIIEERLTINKVKVETGRVRVRTVVDERQEVVRDQVIRGTVDVRRVPVNMEISEPPQVRKEGDTTIIPVFEEVLVTHKKLMLIEELHVTDRVSVEEFQQPIVVRSQRALIERDGAPEEQAEAAGEFQS